MLERRKLLLLTASITISVITISFILFFSPYKITKETLEAFSEINPFYLALALVVHAVSWIIWGFRLKLMADFIGSHAVEEPGKTNHLSLPQVIKIILASLFAACITPSQFGGEPVRIYLLNKNGFSVGDATAIVFNERAMDFIVITVGAATSFLLFRAVVAHHKIIYVTFTVVGVCLCALFAILMYGLAKPEKAKRVFEFFFSKITIKKLDRIKDKIYQEIDNFFRAMKQFRDEGKTTLVLALLVTIGLWMVAFTIPSFILLGFAADPISLHSIAAQFVLLIIVAMPLTPGSSGVAEISITYLYHALVPASILGVFTLIWRLSTYYMNLIVGGITSVKIISETSY
jgi:uncharacterized protein (TIRG00374 family)